jgi:hypothetical protein
VKLSGRLRLTTLGDVLGAVYRERTSGVLEVVETEGPFSGRTHRIHLVDGLVKDVESGVDGEKGGDIGARLDALFLLGDARLTFHVARPGNTYGRARPLDPSEFLHGRPRSRDKVDQGRRRRDPTRARALATLGLPEGADRASVLRAFRMLAARLHPDRFPSATAEERATLMRRFAEITAAYHALVA